MTIFDTASVYISAPMSDFEPSGSRGLSGLPALIAGDPGRILKILFSGEASNGSAVMLPSPGNNSLSVSVYYTVIYESSSVNSVEVLDLASIELVITAVPPPCRLPPFSYAATA